MLRRGEMEGFARDLLGRLRTVQTIVDACPD